MDPPPASPSAATLPLLLLRELRVHQWSKNLLLFLPLLGAHRLGESALLRQATLAFLAFGLVASSVYVTNDLVDLDADRQHPRKRLRPLASGALSLALGRALVPLLLLAGALVALGLPRPFWAALGGYWLVTLAYSLALKRWAVLDVLVLAGLYTARIFAGGMATGVPISEWLASFSMFFFLSLAFVKRASELAHATAALPGRGYRPEDRAAVTGMGLASGYLSALVLALYVTSQEVRRLYSHPQVLWLLCVLSLYWISSLWLAACRGEVDDDPIVYSARDPRSWVVALLGGLVLWAGQ